MQTGSSPRTEGRPAHDVIPDLEGRLFDFAVMPGSPMMGTTALEAYLGLHPDVGIVPFLETDKAFEEETEADLMSRRWHDPTLPDPAFTGLVFHAFVDGVTRPAELNLAARTAAITDRSQFIQIVRHPFDAIRSLYNQWTFAKVDFRLERLGFTGFRDFPLDDLDLSVAQPRPDDIQDLTVLESVEKHLAEYCSQIAYFGSGRRYAEHFDRWDVFDLSEIFPENVEEGMGRLFGLFGADTSFFHPRFRVPGANTAQRFLRSGARVTYLGAPLDVRLAYQSADMYFFKNSRGEDLVEIAAANPPSAWREAGLLDTPIVLLVEPRNWDNLGGFLQSRFVERYAEKLLQNLATCWALAFQRAMETLSPYLFRTGQNPSMDGPGNTFNQTCPRLLTDIRSLMRSGGMWRRDLISEELESQANS